MSNRKLIISSTACLLVFSIIMGVVLTVGPLDVSAKQASSSELKAELKELQAQKAEIAEKLKELEKQQSANMSDMESIINRKGNIEQQIALLHTQIINVTEQINAYSLLIADKQEELQAARERLAELDKLHKERVRAMEEEGELSYWSVLFQATSFSDFLDRLNMIAEIAAADRRRLNELAEAAEQVAQAQKELAEDKAELEKTRTEMEESQKELDTKNAEVDVLLQELTIIAGDLENLHNQFEKEEEDFLDQIADKEKEYNTQLNKEKEEEIKKEQSNSYDFPFYEGIILKDCCSDKTLYLTHGHQADTLNSVFWKLARLLVRYLWTPLENFGVLDPTSASKNNKKKDLLEKKYLDYAKENDCHLLAGHSHRAVLGTPASPYHNCGSCTFPKYITCIELCGYNISLVKWYCSAEKSPHFHNVYAQCPPTFPIYVKREVLSTSSLIQPTPPYQ